MSTKDLKGFIKLSDETPAVGEMVVLIADGL